MCARASNTPALLFAFLAVTVAVGAWWQPAFGEVEGNDSETLVEIPDAALRKALEQALRKDSDEPITRGEMERLFTFRTSGVRQLTGIEYALNLQWLVLINGTISDLGPLAGLESLTTLTLYNNAVSDLGPLAGLESLTTLRLNSNAVSDLGPLAGLTSLTALDLHHNDVSDLGPLAGLTSLTRLYLHHNDVSDLGPLAGLTSLTTLWLDHNDVSDLGPLAGLESLTTLRLSNNAVSDLGPLAGLESLTELWLYNNAVSDLGPLAGLESLTTLRLSNNAVSELGPLAGLESLTELWLYNNAVSDLGPLAGLTSLTTLWLHHNDVSDLGPLAGLTSLTTLWLDHNAVSDLGPLAGLESLTTLTLYNNAVSDLGPLAGLESLTELNFGVTQVSDLAPLAGLTSLTNLQLYYTPVSDLGPLAGLTSLTTLNFGVTLVSDLAPLAGLTSLTYLQLSRNAVSDLAPLAGLASLEVLNLSENAVSDLAPLAGLTRLTNLYLSRNPILDFAQLSAITSLERLHLDQIGMSNVDLAALSDCASLTQLHLQGNQISDVSSLLLNRGIGDGDLVFLEGNRLSLETIETDIPALLERGVDVSFDAPPALPEGAELAEIADPALRGAVETELRKGGGWPITVDEFSKLRYLDVSNHGAEDLTGLELATSLQFLDLGGSDIEDIASLTGLPLVQLSLRDTGIEDVALLADMDQLHYLALDRNSIRELPALPNTLQALHLTDNSIADITALANIYWLRELRVSGNSITSLSPLASTWSLRYLHANDNQVTDIAPLNFQSLAELHLSNNALQDISPLLNGEKLLMVDLRGNPLSGEAMSVLSALRERRVTVLAGETVPYFPAAGTGRLGFVRIVNRSEAGGEVFIEAVDDAGVRVGPVRLQVGARRAVHFNSADLENGNAAKGFGGGVGRPTAGDWRLEVVSSLDVEVLSYIRTGDGFVTAMHDIAPDAMLPFFNPGSNQRQQSTLRVVNTEAEPARWVTGGYDDNGKWHAMAGSIKVRPQHALTLTAQALENAHGLGDGAGKWRLRVRGFPWLAMSLLESPTGHLTNLSTVPNNAEPLADGGWRHRVPLFLAAGGTRAGFLRVVNRSNVSGEVAIEAVDDEGNRAGPVFLELGSRQTVHFNSDDLEAGNNAKGLAGGIGTGEGDWRLALTSELDLQVLSYIRTADGFLTSMHDLAPRAEDSSHRVVFFNPGSNTRQVSKLRLINNGDVAARATIAGVDDGGSNSGAVSVAVPAASARTFTAAELEAGSERLSGRLGDGGGKWRLRVTADAPLAVMSLLETPTGHLANVSTGTAD